jgi:hypothetical protein
MLIRLVETTLTPKFICFFNNKARLGSGVLSLSEIKNNPAQQA